MTDKKAVRIDKFLWCVRVYKTRSLASEACKKGRVIINNVGSKPSRTIVKDEIIVIKKPPAVYTYRVLETVENRISAKTAGNYIVDITPEDELAKPGLSSVGIISRRKKGTGRPTKKERRSLDRLTDDFSKP